MALRALVLIALLAPTAAAANGMLQVNPRKQAPQPQLQVVVVVDAAAGSEWIVLPRAPAALVPSASPATSSPWPTALAGLAISLMLVLAGIRIARRRTRTVRATAAGLVVIAAGTLATGLAVANGMPMPPELFAAMSGSPATFGFPVARVVEGPPGRVEIHLSPEAVDGLRTLPGTLR